MFSSDDVNMRYQISIFGGNELRGSKVDLVNFPAWDCCLLPVSNHGWYVSTYETQWQWLPNINPHRISSGHFNLIFQVWSLPNLNQVTFVPKPRHSQMTYLVKALSVSTCSFILLDMLYNAPLTALLDFLQHWQLASHWLSILWPTGKN